MDIGSPLFRWNDLLASAQRVSISSTRRKNEQSPTIDYPRNRQAPMQASKTRSWLTALASFYLTTLQRKNRCETALHFGSARIASDNRRLLQFMKSLRPLTLVLDDRCQASSTLLPPRLSKTYARNPKTLTSFDLGVRNRGSCFQETYPSDDSCSAIPVLGCRERGALE